MRLSLQLGDAALATQITQAGGSIATVATPSIAGAISTGAWAIPVVGAGIAAVALAVTAFINRKGPKQKVATTKIVEEVVPLMQQNVREYFAGPRTRSSQALALANFDALWQHGIVERCGIPEMGEPGQRCISERQPGGIYDMARDNRDPIANDPDVKPDPTPAEQVENAALSLVPQLTPEQVATARKFFWPVVIGLGILLATSGGKEERRYRRGA